MPLDLTLSEFLSAEAPEIPIEHHEKHSALLGAMKRAGQSLVQAAKRAVREPVLSTMMAAGAALCAPHAKAQVPDCPGGYIPYLSYGSSYSCEILGDNAASPPTLGPFDHRPGAFPAGDPVDVATGNVFLHIVDYTTAGPNPLQFIRYYNGETETAGVNTLSYAFGNVDNGSGAVDYTLRAQNSLGGPAFGTPVPSHWRNNYDRYLQFTYSGSSLTQVVAERPDGQQITFAPSGSSWAPPTDQDYTLTQSGSTWTLSDRNDTKESYTDSGSGWAQLNTITARNGYQQTLSYGSTPLPVAVAYWFVSSGTPTVTAYYPSQLQSVTDSYGRSLTFSYNSNKMLDSVSTPDSLVVSYGYTYVGSSPGGYYNGNAGYMLTSVSYNTSPVTSQTYSYNLNSVWPYQISSITDENGNTAVAWQYNGDGSVWNSQQGNIANSTTFSYGTNYTIVSNAYGVNDTYSWSTITGIPKITSISRAATSNTAAASESMSYDTNGFVSSFTDWNSNTTNYTNNSLGNPTSITEAYGSSVARTTSIAYDATWLRLPATITTPGVTRTFTYDTSGNPLTMTDTDTTTTSAPYGTNGQTRETQWTWNGTGQMLSAQMPRTDLTVKYQYSWNSDGSLASITDPVGNATSISAHTGGGYPTTIVDPNSVTTTLGWDTRLNLNTVAVSTTGGTLTTTYSHDPANNLSSVQKPDGSTLTYTYDTANRLTNIADLRSNSISFTLDYLGDVTYTTMRSPSAGTAYVDYAYFDKLGRRLQYTDGAGNTSSYTYDPNGNLTSLTDPLSKTWNYTYDALNRLSTKQDPTPGGTTTWTRDAHNRLTSVQDANGNSTTYTRTGFGDVAQLASPDSGTSVYYYDKDSNLTQKVLAGGQTANFTYDANERNLTVAYPADSSLNISKTYDQAGHGKGIGRLTSVTDQAGSDSFTYDERGNITAENRVLTSIGTLSTATSFDAASNISSITYPSGTVVNYSRDSMGLVTGVSATPPGASSPATVASSITREPFGPVNSFNFGNGVANWVAFDDAYNELVRNDAGSTNITWFSYGYDYRNSLHTITDHLNSANSQTFTYDALDRLSSATSGTGGYGTYAWTWDAVNNLQSQTTNSVATTYSQNSGTNQLASFNNGTTTTTVDTTSNGNIADFKVGGTAITSYSYNAANQLSGATGPLGASATYQYGFDGKRLLKTPSGGYPITYQYARAANELLSENDLHAGQTADYIYMDPGRDSRPIGQVDPTSGYVYYMHTDRLGTPVALTDSGANVVWSASYNPFGDTSSFSGTLTTQSLRFPGQYFDPETGNNHNGFRDYAGALTRYVQSDPIGLAGGMNTYQYVKGNAFKWTDRFGLDPGNNGGGCGLLICPTFNAPDDSGDPDPNLGDGPGGPITPCSEGSVLCGGGGNGGGDCGLLLCPTFNAPDDGGDPGPNLGGGDGGGGGGGDSAGWGAIGTGAGTLWQQYTGGGQSGNGGWLPWVGCLVEKEIYAFPITSGLGVLDFGSAELFWRTRNPAFLAGTVAFTGGFMLEQGVISSLCPR